MKKGKVEYKNAVPVPIGELIPYERNAKQHDERQLKNLMKSITDFGFTQPLVIDKDNVIVIGHGRYEAAKRLGLPEVPCIKREDLTDKEVKQLRILDNKLNESPWDSYLYATELESVELEGYDLDDDIAETEEHIDVLDDGYEETEKVPARTTNGEIWKLGNHRLMCGDSTSIEDVEKLMGGARADLLITDPPYNVDYTGKTKDALKIQNDSMEDETFRQFLRDAFTAADSVMKPGAAFYIWHADSEGYNFRGACHDIGWTVRQCLVWEKNQMVMGRQDYQWKHEPCLYGWKDGAGHSWYSDRSQTTILNFSRPQRSEMHPTMKPVALFGYQIQNSSKKGDFVLDLFGGSGTTIVCCEQSERNAFVMELDPHYCDVIIDRWEQLTGKKAQREA